MKRQLLIAGVLLAAVAIVAAACGGGDDGGGADRSTGGHDREDYVTLLGGGGEELTDEEAACAAAAMVDTVGVDALEDAEAWGKIQANPDGALADFGITLDEAQSSALFDGLTQCKDWRAYFEEAMVSAGLSPELAACTMDNVDDAVFEQYVVLSFTEGDAGVDAFEKAGASCAAAGAT